MHKFVRATFEPNVHTYMIPLEWDMKDVHVNGGGLYYNGERQDHLVPYKFELAEEVTKREIVEKDDFQYEDLEEFFDCVPVETLETRNERRIKCYEKYEDWLAEACKGKGAKLRKQFRTFLMFGTRPFKTEDDEYEYIHKFPRGEWEWKSAFAEEDQEKIVNIAREYGAFDY